MVTPCKEHVELGDKFSSLLLPAELCWCWIILLGCNWRLKFFINGILLNRSVVWQSLISSTITTLSSLSLLPAIISLQLSPLFSPSWGPPLFRQIKLLFCRIETEILNMLNNTGQHWAADWKHYSRSDGAKFLLIPRQLIYNQKQSHNRDFPLELLCKFPLIGSVFN